MNVELVAVFGVNLILVGFQIKLLMDIRDGVRGLIIKAGNNYKKDSDV